MTPAARLARARWWPAGLAWALWGVFVAGMALVAWLDQLLRQAGRSDLVQWDVEGAIYALLGLVSAATVGAVVASRRPAHPVGWLLLAFGLLAITSFVVAVVAAAGSLVVRFRRAQGVERQQLHWLALAAALVPLVALGAALIGGPAATPVVTFAAGPVTWLVPLALLLAGGYALVALVLGRLLGRDSSLVVAAATLAVAAAFQPARHRIQQAVDRRFNRRRYDAAQTIAAFSTRLRQQVDLDSLTAELLAVAEETMQPTQSSLWLRPSDSAALTQRMRGTSRADGRPTVAGSAFPLR